MKKSFIYFNKVLFLLSNSQKKKIIFIIFFMFISLLVELFGLGLIIPIITIFIDYDSIQNYKTLSYIFKYFGEPSQFTLIISSIIFIFTFFLIKTITVSFILFQQMKFVLNSQSQLSMRLFSFYLKMPYENFIKLNSSLLLKNITKETQLFAINCIQPLLLISSEILIFFGIILFLIFVEPLGALISFICLFIPGFIFYKFSKNKLINWGYLRMNFDEKRFQMIQDSFGAFKIISIFNKQKFFINKYDDYNLGSADQDLKLRFIDQLPRLLLELFAIIGLSSLLLALVLQNANFNNLIPILGLFAFAVFRIMPSINRILSQFTSLRFSDSVIDELYLILNNSDVLELEDNKTKNKIISNLENQIELDKVSFKYDGNKNFILKDIDLKIKKNSKIAIVGSSGNGKSTLLDLILGVLKPVSGRILYDNLDIAKNNLNHLELIGYIPQNIFLIDDTIKNNICFAIDQSEVDVDKLQNAIIKSALFDFIDSLPNGLNTNVGERGVRLSGGQIQRIGIARALYHNPKILILDEATSALDFETEKTIMKSILSLNRDKTIIVVTHRFESVKNCDLVYEITNNNLKQKFKLD